jgi:CheY-like chemotaxis protein/Tfp pilus assembly protein PilZ
MPVKVLIVDDMRSFLDLETSFLKRADCTIIKAVNGLEALRLAKSEKPDIIFLDLEMPVMNGLECSRFIKSDIELKNTPIVIITATEGREKECYKVGCNSYLKKPVDEDIFISEIKKFVNIKERNDPRVDVSIPANVLYKGTKSAGLLRNLSKGGLLLETKEPFGIGTTITVDFSLPGAKSKVKAKAMVVRTISGRSSGKGAVGLSFLSMEGKHQSIIDSFIEGQLPD